MTYKTDAEHWLDKFLATDRSKQIRIAEGILEWRNLALENSGIFAEDDDLVSIRSQLA